MGTNGVDRVKGVAKQPAIRSARGSYHLEGKGARGRNDVAGTLSVSRLWERGRPAGVVVTYLDQGQARREPARVGGEPPDLSLLPLADLLKQLLRGQIKLEAGGWYV